ncbi:thiol reductant ABC exporter subunit CydD [Alteribacter lacisalsi]|uniref:Thiol reductant ABC exporter subunit CydD n=2 Tax=Alteribacter lacisalsi TaxID=2045244 RepID=A0A2W0HE06_9BACI|nr:thiol reductant ABC exporter subunit CydD [Alteribacter lacisalsi]
MKELKRLAFAQKTHMRLLYILAFLYGAAIIAQAWLIVTVVDGVFLQNETISWALPLLLILLAVFTVRTMIAHFTNRTGLKMAGHVKKQYREMLVKKFTGNSLQASGQGQSGEKVSVLLDGVDEIDSFYSHYIPQLVITYIVPLMILVTIFIVNPYSGLILIITAPFIPFCMILIGKMTQKKQDEQVEKLTAFSGRFLDSLQGLATLKLFGRAKKQEQVIEDASLNFRDSTMNVLKVAFLSALMLEFIAMLSVALIAVEVGLRLVIYQSITFFTAFLVLILAPEFFNLLKNLGTAFHSGRGSVASAGRIREELDRETKHVSWGKDVLNTSGKPPELVMRNLSFSYGEDRFALSGISATIAPGDRIAAAGASGSGKTTLVHILAGLLDPDEGDILISGHERSTITEQSWFDEVGYLSQHPYLFSGTIAENIMLGAGPDVTREEVLRAGGKAGLDPVAEALDNGYDTFVGEGGRGLSGGEKQRVALARVFLKKPSLLLFDEPTVGLDLETEQILQRSLNELGDGATVITVAHRLHTIKHADLILFMNNGKIADRGTHEDLLKSSADYRQMVYAHQGGESR